MKIAIVAPSPVPFTIGGAEKLWWGLQNYINNHTPHQCELFKISARENNFWDLIELYYTFYKLDLSYFDLVITTKYPAWMVRHQNHTVYLQHHLRGLFDTYHFCNEPKDLPEQFKTGHIGEIFQRLQNERPTENDIDAIFELLQALKTEQNNYDSYNFKFPGPFIRSLIHYFDAYALAPERVKHYFSISKNVQLRDEYFPRNVPVGVIYHPSKVEQYKCKNYDYLFTVSRLDSPKRIDLLIRAMKHVPYDVHFKIAGTGPGEARLKELAREDPRIEFIGYTSEDQIIELYANALCVLYIPYDEDYGLITIEGMKSKKPIITATDSGGSLEFVINNETGFAVNPDPREIADKINYLIKHKDEARRMGCSGYLKVKDVTWDNVVGRLLNEPVHKKQRRKKILVLTTFSCYPPHGGGQQRIYHIYTRLAKQFDVTICSIVEANKPYQDLILDNGLNQICIPQSQEHAESQWEVEGRLKENLYDICMAALIDKSSDYVETVRKLLARSDIVIFSHPYLYKLRKYIDESKVVIYEAHNVEYFLKRDYVKNDYYNSLIFEIERDACLNSNVVFTTSEKDKVHLVELYQIPQERVFVAPNGVDPSKIRYIDTKMKIRQKKMFSIPSTPLILFVGSWHPPNLEALKYIADTLAPRFRDCKFLVVGSIGAYYHQMYGKMPRNVLEFGVIDDEEKYELYKLADIAINPMFSGSGTNLKMLDYMSAGIPVISTPVGARGLDIEDNTHAIICSAEAMPAKITELLNDSELCRKIQRNERSLVEEKYSWDSIVREIEGIIWSLRP